MTFFEHTPPAPLILLALVAALALAVYSFWRFLPGSLLSRILLVLHAIALFVLAWCLLLPARRETTVTWLRPRFVIALDTSQSMTLKPDEHEPTRWETAQRALNLPWLEHLASQGDIEVVPLDKQLHDAVAPAAARELQPDGEATHLRAGLAELSGRYGSLHTAGMLLLTDGLDTREVHDDWAAERRPFPIYTLRLEDPTLWVAEPDVRVDAVTTPRRVTRNRATELKAMISGQGTRGQPLSVQLFRNDELLQEQPALIPDSGGRHEALFTLEHPEAGIFTYRVFIPPIPGERLTNDNEIAVAVHVADDRNRVLYVEGSPRWEYRFLRRALLSNPDISATAFFSGPEGAPQAGTPAHGVTADLSPHELALFKIVILGNLDAGEMTAERAGHLVQFVETGGSLVVLGGSRAWSGQGLSQTELRRVLPVREHAAVPLQAEEAFPVTLTDEARAHPAFAGDEQRWERLPGVLAVFPGAVPSLGAQVLVEADTPQGRQPLVVTHRYGQGMVAAVFTDSLWRWQLSPDDSRHQPYQRFWAQMIAWMMPEEDEAVERVLRLLGDRERLHLGETIELSAFYQGEALPEQATVRCLVTYPDGREVPFNMPPQTLITPSGEQYQGFALEFMAEAAGLYSAQAVLDGVPGIPPSDPLSFYVQPYSPETVPRPIDVEILQALSAASGGEYFETLEVLDRILSGLALHPEEEERSEYYSLWRRWLLLVLLMALLATAWAARKTGNMP